MRKPCAQNVCNLLVTSRVRPTLSTGTGSVLARSAYKLAVIPRRINNQSGTLYHVIEARFTSVNEQFSPLSTPPITTATLIKKYIHNRTRSINQP